MSVNVAMPDSGGTPENEGTPEKACEMPVLKCMPVNVWYTISCNY